MKNLICKLFNLVRKEDLQSLERNVVERDKFIIEMSKDLDQEKFKVLYTGQSVNNIEYSGKIYILGNYVSMVDCTADAIVIAPGCEKCYFGGITRVNRSFRSAHGSSIFYRDK